MSVQERFAALRKAQSNPREENQKAYAGRAGAAQTQETGTVQKSAAARSTVQERLAALQSMQSNTREENLAAWAGRNPAAGPAKLPDAAGDGGTEPMLRALAEQATAQKRMEESYPADTTSGQRAMTAEDWQREAQRAEWEQYAADSRARRLQDIMTRTPVQLETADGMVENKAYTWLNDQLTGEMMKSSEAERRASEAETERETAEYDESWQTVFDRAAQSAGGAGRLNEMLDQYNTANSGVTGSYSAGAARDAIDRENELLALGLTEDELRELAIRRGAERNRTTSDMLQKETEQTAAEHPVLSSIASVPLNLASGAGTADLALQKLLSELDGSGRPVDFYSGATQLSRTAGEIRGSVSESLAERFGKEIAGTNVASFLYQTGMSMADSAAIAGLSLIGVPAAEILLSGSAATQAAAEAKERGGSDAQALGYGLAAGIAEGLFERVSLEKLTENIAGGLSEAAARQTGGQRILTLLKAAGLQGSTEASEEVFTTIANTISDAVIMGDRSDYNAAVQALAASGVPEDEARKQAAIEWLTGLAGDALGGFLSGGIMGGGGTAISAAAQSATIRQAAQGEAAQNAASGTETAAEAEESTAVNTDPEQHTRPEQAVIDEYQAAADPELAAFVEVSVKNKGANSGRYTLKPVSDRAAADIRALTGVDATGFQTVIEQRTAEHIVSRHGERGSADSSMRDINDIARMQYVLDNYDSMEYAGKSSGHTTVKGNGRTGLADTVRYIKAVNGTYYVVEAVPDTKAKTTYVVSAYMTKADNGTQAPDTKSPGNTPNASLASSLSASSKAGGQHPANAENGPAFASSETADAAPVGATIPQTDLTVNSENGNRSASDGSAIDSEAEAVSRAQRVQMHTAMERMTEREQGETFDAAEKNRRIDRVTRTLGKEGRTAFIRTYDPGNSERAFEAYYQFGLTGTSYEQVRGMDGVPAEFGSISEEAARAAVKAGNRDAKASLRTAERRASKARTADSGFLAQDTVQTAIRDGRLNRETAELIDQIGTRLKTRIVYDETLGPAADGYYDAGAGELHIAADTADPVMAVFSHEITHRMQDLAPERYTAYRNRAVELAAEEAQVSEADMVQRKIDGYERRGVTLTAEGAMDEIAADYAKQLLKDEQTVRDFLASDAAAARSFFDRLREIWGRIKRAITGTQHEREYQGALALWEKAFDAAERQAERNEDSGQNNVAREGGERQYSLREEFRQELDEWLGSTEEKDRTVSHGYFKIGATSEALKSIGVRDSEIFWRKQKVGYIMEEHPEMDAETLKAVPQILEHPTAILKSLTRDDSIVLFGDLTASNGERVMAALELTPRKGGGMSTEFSLITSAYSRGERNIQNLIQNSEILYLDKNRADTWLMQLRVQFPSGQPVYGSIGSIRYEDGKVNISGKTLQELGGEIADGRRYSLRGEEQELAEELKKVREQRNRYRQQYKKAQERAAYWKTEATGRRIHVPDEKGIRAVAESLMEGYTGERSVKSVEKSLTELYKQMKQAYSADNAAAFRRAWEKANDGAMRIAWDIVRNTQVKNDAIAQEYEEIKAYVSGRRISINAALRSDLEATGGYREIKNYLFGKRLYLGADGYGVDAFYGELSGRFGAYFPEDILNPADQLARICEVLRGMDDVYENPYGPRFDQAASALALQIMEQASRVEEAPETQLQQWEKRVGQIQQECGQTVQAAVQEQRRKAEELKTFWRTTYQNDLQERRAEQNRQSLLKVAQRLERIGKKTSSVNKAVISEIVGQLDTVAVRLMADREINTKYIRETAGRTFENLAELDIWYQERKQELGEDFIPDPRIERMIDRLNKTQIVSLNQDANSPFEQGSIVINMKTIRDWYNEVIANDPDMKLEMGENNDVARMIQELESLSNRGSVEVYDLNTLTNILRFIEHTIRTKNRLINEADRREVYQLATESMRDIEASEGVKKENGLWNAYSTASLSALREIKRIVGYRKESPLYRAAESLDRGQTRMLDYQMRASKLFDGLNADAKQIERFRGKKAELIEVTGMTKDGIRTVKITPAMRVSLYLHSQNSANLRHIEQGGVTVPDWELYRKGKTKEAYSARNATIVRFTPSQVKAICSQMTDFEKQYAEKAFYYFNHFAKDAINETSNALRGYDIATVNNYFPLVSNRNFTRREIESLVRDGTLEGMGMLKERQNYAGNPITLEDVTSALERNIESASKYVGLAVPLRNFNKLYKTTSAGYENSMQQQIEEKWGDKATTYIENLLTDLQSNRQTSNTKFDRLRGMSAQAVLSANVSVTMKQAASYPTAAAVLGWKPLAKAMKDVGKVDTALIAKYTPLLWYRSKGFSTTELADIAQRSGESWVNKKAAKALGTGWIQKADMVTTEKLWKASEYYVRENNSALAVGTEEYYKAVAEIYNQVLTETQPDYTTMQRPDILRNPHQLVRAVTMYMTQRLQNFNIVFDAAGELRAAARADKAQGTEQTRTQLGQARSTFARAVSSQIVAAAVITAMNFAAAAIYGQLKRYRDDEDKWTAASVAEQVARDMSSTLLGSTLFGSEIYEAVMTLTAGDTWYGVEVTNVEVINNLVSAVAAVRKALPEYDEDEETWDFSGETLARKSYALVEEAAVLAGVPAGSVRKFISGMTKHVLDLSMGTRLGNYYYAKIVNDTSASASALYDEMAKAYLAGDMDSYDAMYDDLIRSGYEADALYSNLVSRIKKTTAYGDAMSLLRGEVADAMQQSEWYEALDDEHREAADEDAKHYAMVKTMQDMMEEYRIPSTYAWFEKADSFVAAGGSVAEYILFRQMTSGAAADRDEDGETVPGSKREKIVEIIDSLDVPDGAKDVLYRQAGYAESTIGETPWR